MGSVSKRYCKNGPNCLHVRQGGADGPIALGRSHRDDICDRCKYNSNASEDVPEELEELFGVARVLLNNDVKDEDEIVPTLVFAGNLDGTPGLESIWDGLAKAQKGSEARAELESQLYTLFGGLVLPSRVVEGVPVVRRAPFWISVTKDKDGPIEEIAFDVFKRSVTRREVRKWYEWYLKLEGVDYDLNDLSRGVVAYKTDNREFFRLIARPEERSVDTDGRFLPITEGVRKFPHPEAVAGMYEGLRDLMTFSGLPPLLMGRQRGPDIEPHNLVPACVAWYLSKRGRLLEERGTISHLTNILNDHLLMPCGKGPAMSISRDIPKVKDAILHLERAIPDHARI